MRRDLRTDALIMSANKSLEDVTTLLEFAADSDTPNQKMRHVEEAIARLQDVRENLRELAER